MIELEKITDSSVDLIIVDPPYNAKKNFQNDNLSHDEFIDFVKKWFSACVQKLKKNGSFYCFINEKYLFHFKSIFDGLLIFRRLLVWKFEGYFAGFHKNYQNRTEYVLFYTKSDEYTFNSTKENPSKSFLTRWESYADASGNIPYEALSPSDRQRFKKENYDRNPRNINRGLYQGNVFDQMRVRYKVHESQKPESIIEKIILISSNPNDLVLDFFMGSGTVPFCAKKLGRDYVGIEIESKFFDIAVNRLKGDDTPRETRPGDKTFSKKKLADFS